MLNIVKLQITPQIKTKFGIPMLVKWQINIYNFVIETEFIIGKSFHIQNVCSWIERKGQISFCSFEIHSRNIYMPNNIA